MKDRESASVFRCHTCSCWSDADCNPVIPSKIELCHKSQQTGSNKAPSNHLASKWSSFHKAVRVEVIISRMASQTMPRPSAALLRRLGNDPSADKDSFSYRRFAVVKVNKFGWSQKRRLHLYNASKGEKYGRLVITDNGKGAAVAAAVAAAVVVAAVVAAWRCCSLQLSCHSFRGHRFHPVDRDLTQLLPLT